ncbi:MAG: DUF123 domain-containing protein [Desulfuromonas sp.]|nr:MAG: DUF123 domain-containing protein [Desulfuromonas sp.]
MDSKPGTYILVLESSSDTIVEVGRWGLLELKPGYYLYVGSAFGPGGVRARVARHCRSKKSNRWHIDYLRAYTSLKSIWYCLDPEHLEHQWAEALADLHGMVPIHGFGCSDCKCYSHLCFSRYQPELVTFVHAVGQSVLTGNCDLFET